MTSPITPSHPPPLVPSDAPPINDTPVELDASTTLKPGESKHKTALASPQGGDTKARDEMLTRRKKDPGVIVDVPGGLTAEEVQAVVGDEGV